MASSVDPDETGYYELSHLITLFARTRVYVLVHRFEQVKPSADMSSPTS